MTDMTKEIGDYYPKRDEIEAILIEARIMRARVLREGSYSLWSMLRRAITRKSASGIAVSA